MRWYKFVNADIGLSMMNNLLFLGDRLAMWQGSQKIHLPHIPNLKSPRQRAVTSSVGRLITRLIYYHGLTTKALAEGVTKQTSMPVSPASIASWGREDTAPRAIWDDMLLPALEQLESQQDTPEGGVSIEGNELAEVLAGWMEYSGSSSIRELAKITTLPAPTLIRWSAGQSRASRRRIMAVDAALRK